jgi:hypothetical protein
MILLYGDVEAWDRVNGELLSPTLEKIGMSQKYVRLVRRTYVNTRVQYRLGVDETDWMRS